MHNFREPQVWQKAINLVTEVYSLSVNFPSEEKFGLTSQIRGSSVSIPSNIAEGCSRESNKDITRFLRISIGSAFELETQLIIANNLELLTSEQLGTLIPQVVEIQKMIVGFEKSLFKESLTSDQKI